MLFKTELHLNYTLLMFIQSFSKYLLRIFYVAGISYIVYRDTVWNKRDKVSILTEIRFLGEGRTYTS